MLWVLMTLAAAAAQTARNAMQSSLTGSLGTLGATQVRFLFGLPFAICFFVTALTISGASLSPLNERFFLFTTAGAIAQILGTVALLAAMQARSFSVATAFSKTEAVQVSVFGLLLLGDDLSLPKVLAIVTATAGVFLMAFRADERLTRASALPVIQGIASGGFYAIAAVGFRGGITSLSPDVAFYVRASETLMCSLMIQSVLLGLWMLVFQRPQLVRSFRMWRQSSFAGFMGALASQFWFLGFSLTSAANVRTLGLLEVIFAQIVSQRLFSQALSWRELAGMALVIAGVGLLLATHV
jgi:uncharacterized membrane protein